MAGWPDHACSQGLTWSMYSGRGDVDSLAHRQPSAGWLLDGIIIPSVVLQHNRFDNLCAARGVYYMQLQLGAFCLGHGWG